MKTLFKQKFKQIMKSTAVIRFVAALVFVYSKLVGITNNWRIIDLTKTLRATEDKNAIWVSWHARATMMPFFWNKYVKRRMSALVSPHQDGQIIANFLKWYDITPVCGSTNENPRQSALNLLRDLIDGADLFISPDGPRGPRMRMKKSPVYFAKKTGKPIICVCYSVSNAIIINKAWDKMMVPLPFGKGFFACSEPLYVPENASDDELEVYRKKLEDIANNLSAKCDQAVGRKPVWPADVNEYKRKK